MSEHGEATGDRSASVRVAFPGFETVGMGLVNLHFDRNFLRKLPYKVVCKINDYIYSIQRLTIFLSVEGKNCFD
jgi:hypothetical protein